MSWKSSWENLEKKLNEFKMMVADANVEEVKYLDKYAKVSDNPYKTLSNALTLDYIVRWIALKALAKYSKRSWLEPDKPLLEITVKENTLPQSLLDDVVETTISNTILTIETAMNQIKRSDTVIGLYLPITVYALPIIARHKKDVEEATKYLKKLIVWLEQVHLHMWLHLAKYTRGEGNYVEIYSGQHRTNHERFKGAVKNLGYTREKVVKPATKEEGFFRTIWLYDIVFGRAEVWVDCDDHNFGFINMVLKLDDEDQRIVDKLIKLDYKYKNIAYPITIENITISPIGVEETAETQIEIIKERIERTLRELGVNAVVVIIQPQDP